MKFKWRGREIDEGERTPWWGRVWRWNYRVDIFYVLPIPICYIARLLWNIWCLSFRVRPNRYEKEMRMVYHAGFNAGWDKFGSNAIQQFERVFGRSL